MSLGVISGVRAVYFSLYSTRSHTDTHTYTQWKHEGKVLPSPRPRPDESGKCVGPDRWRAYPHTPGASTIPTLFAHGNTSEEDSFGNCIRPTILFSLCARKYISVSINHFYILRGTRYIDWSSRPFLALGGFFTRLFFYTFHVPFSRFSAWQMFGPLERTRVACVFHFAVVFFPVRAVGFVSDGFYQ